jgi:hypothetical protein
MADYTFKATLATQQAYWDDPSSWTGGVVPNGLDADVVFPLVTYIPSNAPYISNVDIRSGESFTAHSIQLNDSLDVEGNLSVSTDITQNYGHLGVYGNLTVGGTLSDTSGAGIGINSNATLSAQTLATGPGVISGGGHIIAGTFNNGSELGGLNPSLTVDATTLNNSGTLGMQIDGDVTINATTLTNTGTMQAVQGVTTVSVTPGGFTNLSAGTLSGGNYTVVANGHLMLDVGQVISSDAATISLYGGTITSHDPVTGQDLSLTDTLHTVAPGGVLNLADGNNSFGALDIQGSVSLTHAQLTSSQLVISAGGTLDGVGTSGTPAVVNGDFVNNGFVAVSSGPLMLNGDVTGTGYMEVGVSAQLELSGTTAQTVVLDASTGGPYSSPATVQIDHPDRFTGSLTPSGLGDKIIIPNISASSITGYAYSGTSTGGTLTLQEQGGGALSFAINGNFTTADFHVSAGPQTLSSDPPSLLVTVGSAPPVCFATGTMIATPAGEVAVEALREGDEVSGADGRIHPVVWIGHRHTDCANSPWKADLSPVLFEVGSVADNVPSRPLMVSPGHSIEIESGWLIQAGHLLNGSSIRQMDVSSVTYWHIELKEHAILLANGVPAESFLDVGNRSEFENGGPVVSLHPRFLAEQLDRYCLPVIQDPVVRCYFRDKLAARVSMLGAAPATDALPLAVVR